MTHYRIVASLALTLLAFIGCFGIVNLRVIFVDAWFLIWLLLELYTLTGLFVWVSSSAGEGVQVSLMAEQEWAREHEGSRDSEKMEGVMREMERLAGWERNSGSIARK